MILNSDAALDIARQGVGPVKDVSVEVTINYGGIPQVGTPVRVKAIFVNESIARTEKPVEQPRPLEKKLKYKKGA